MNIPFTSGTLCSGSMASKPSFQPASFRSASSNRHGYGNSWIRFGELSLTLSRRYELDEKGSNTDSMSLANAPCQSMQNKSFPLHDLLSELACLECTHGGYGSAGQLTGGKDVFQSLCCAEQFQICKRGTDHLDAKWRALFIQSTG